MINLEIVYLVFVCVIVVQFVIITYLCLKHRSMTSKYELHLGEIAGLVDAMAEDVAIQDELLDNIAREALLMSRECPNEQWSKSFAKIVDMTSFKE